MNKYIKNISGSTKTYLGTTVLNLEYYLIPESEILDHSSDEEILFDITNGDILMASSNTGNNDISSPSDGINFLKGINSIEIDLEGRQVQRVAAGKKGWTYMAHPLEITTSTINGAYSSDYLGNVRTDYEIQLYTIDNTLITEQSSADLNCVKTVVTFKPDYDYEIISGNIFQDETTTDDIRVWVIGGAILNSNNTPVSVKEFVAGLNLKFVGNDDHIETDGRASKMMTKDITAYGLPYPAYQGNCFQFIIKHPAGKKHNIMSVLEYFRG